MHSPIGSSRRGTVEPRCGKADAVHKISFVRRNSVTSSFSRRISAWSAWARKGELQHQSQSGATSCAESRPPHSVAKQPHGLQPTLFHSCPLTPRPGAQHGSKSPLDTVLMHSHPTIIFERTPTELYTERWFDQVTPNPRSQDLSCHRGQNPSGGRGRSCLRRGPR